MTTKKFEKMVDDILEEHKETFKALGSHDITFCSNGDCPMKKNCHRSLDNLTTNPSKHYLSVSHFEPVNGECEDFMDRRK